VSQGADCCSMSHSSSFIEAIERAHLARQASPHNNNDDKEVLRRELTLEDLEQIVPQLLLDC
jgi:hypothetical protein